MVVWRGYSQKMQPFDFDLFFDKNVTIDPNLDSGLINSPKIFRRQAPYEILKKAEIMQYPDFKSYLQALDDNCYATKEFLEKGEGAELYSLSDSIDTEGQCRVFAWRTSIYGSRCDAQRR